MRKCIVGINMLMCIGGLSAARPFNTDDVGTVDQGMFELELGFDFRSGEARPGLDFKHGITDRMDMGVGLGYTLAPEEESGFENAELALKFAVIPDIFSVSISGTFGLESYILSGIFSRTFGPLEIDGNIGYETGDAANTGEGTVMYSLALIFSAEPLAFGIEGGGEKEGIQSWLVGGRYVIFDGFAVDAGLYGDFDEDMALTATVGVHYEF